MSNEESAKIFIKAIKKFASKSENNKNRDRIPEKCQFLNNCISNGECYDDISICQKCEKYKENI